MNHLKEKETPSLQVPFLDRNYLLTFYESDLEDILWAMETFSQVTIKDFHHLLPLALDNRWTEMKELAHRLKPNFKLVGFSKVYHALLALEMEQYSSICTTQKLQQVRALYITVFQDYLPLLSIEMSHLRFCLQQGWSSEQYLNRSPSNSYQNAKHAITH